MVAQFRKVTLAVNTSAHFLITLKHVIAHFQKFDILLMFQISVLRQT
jgi:hypothetical protein